MRDGIFRIGLAASVVVHAVVFSLFYFQVLDAKQPTPIVPTPITISLYEAPQIPTPPAPQPKKEPKKTVQKPQKQPMPPQITKEATKDSIPVKTVEAQAPTPQETPKAKPQLAAAKTDTDEVKKYLAKLRKSLQDNLEYPYYAKKAGIEGVTVVCFCVKKDGSMPTHSLKIIKGSGHAVLDRHALETVQNSAPFPSPPNGELEVTIPVSFTIKS